MKTTLASTVIALVLATGALHAATRPAPAPKPALDLKAATAPPAFGTWYCLKLQDRCDNGDANACKLFAQNCTD